MTLANTVEALAAGIREHVERVARSGEYHDLQITYGDAGDSGEPWSVRFAICARDMQTGQRSQRRTVTGRTILEALDRARHVQIEQQTRGTLMSALDDSPQMCEAHPDDCPLGPNPHPFVPQTASDTGPCCCRQPWEAGDHPAIVAVDATVTNFAGQRLTRLSTVQRKDYPLHSLCETCSRPVDKPSRTDDWRHKS